MYSEPSQRSKIQRFGKITIAFNYFRKTLCRKSLRWFWICVRFYICQGSEYSRIVNMPGLRISRVYLFLIFTKISKPCVTLDKVLNMFRDTIMKGLWVFQSYQYIRLWHMPGLHKVLNIAWINCSEYNEVLLMPGQSFSGFWICLRL